MKRKIVREALYFRLYAVDGVKREPDEQRAEIQQRFKVFADAAGLPRDTQLAGADVDDFLDIFCYVDSIEGLAFHPLALPDSVEDMGRRFGEFLELEEGLVLRLKQIIAIQRRPSSRITAPAAPDDLTDDEKKVVSDGKTTLEDGLPVT